MKFIG